MIHVECGINVLHKNKVVGKLCKQILMKWSKTYQSVARLADNMDTTFEDVVLENIFDKVHLNEPYNLKDEITIYSIVDKICNPNNHKKFSYLLIKMSKTSKSKLKTFQIRISERDLQMLDKYNHLDSGGLICLFSQIYHLHF